MITAENRLTGHIAYRPVRFSAGEHGVGGAPPAPYSPKRGRRELIHVTVFAALDTSVLAAGGALFAGACAVLALVGAVAWRQRRRPVAPRPTPAECARLRAEAEVLVRHAAAAAQQAVRADAAAAGAGDRAA